MRAVKGDAGGVAVIDVDPPTGPGELITVESVSICASDLRYLHRGSTQIQGHEIAGTTADGTAVLAAGLISCGTCERCTAGQQNLCALAGTLIVGMTAPGGMAEYFRAPADSLIPVPTGLSLDDASLIEPGAVAWHACAKAGVSPGMRVAVVGAGAVGLLAAVAADAMGADTVAVDARHDYQSSLAASLGYGPVDGAYDAVIEAAGTESGLTRAIDLATPLGVVSSVGVYGPEITWPYRAAFVKEVIVVPSMGYCGHGAASELAQVAGVLAARPEVAKALITHRFGINDAVTAFETASARPAGTMKVVVHPQA